MIKKLYILSILLLFLAACNSDDVTNSASNEAEKITVPIEIYTSQPTNDAVSRTTGDPGVDDKLPAPTHIYAWACVNVDDNSWTVEFKKVDVSTDKWTYTEATSGSTNGRYSLSGYLDFTVAGSSGKVYVVASTKELTSAELKVMYDGFTESEYSAGYVMKTVNDDPSSTLAAMTFKPTWTGDDAWTSTDLRDLYSNPNSDTDKDAEGYGNGQINNDASGKHHIGTVRLYHCAAKVDFNWEVDSTIQSTTSIKSIQVKGLPTILTVFEPTANTDGTGTCTVAGTESDAVNAINDGNKWIGRACAYVLQPAAGTISYTATFSGREAASGSTAAAPEGSIYTTWYRVLATVK